MTKLTSFPAVSGLVVLTAAVFASSPLLAARPFDGTWGVRIIPAGAVTSAQGQFECPESHITLTIKDGRVSALLQRGPDAEIRDGYDGAAMPLTGTVDDNGHLVATWQGLPWTGEMTRNHLNLSWRGECGVRNGTGQPL